MISLTTSDNINLRQKHFEQIKEGLKRMAELALDTSKAGTVLEEELSARLLKKGAEEKKEGKMANISIKELYPLAETAQQTTNRPIQVRIVEDGPTETRQQTLSLFKSLHIALRNSFDLSHEEARLIILFLAEKILEPYLEHSTLLAGQTLSGYRRLINYFFEVDPGEVQDGDPLVKHLNKAEARAVWFAYLNLTITDKVIAFPPSYRHRDLVTKLPKPNQITVNTAIWSFEYKKALPIHRHYYNFSNLDEGPTGDIRKRRDSFIALGKAQRYFSTAADLVKYGLSASFYFDRTESRSGEMTIYQLEMESGRIISTDIDGRHREKMGLSGSFSFADRDDYITQRKKHSKHQEREVRYQNQVLRWYIRTGLLDPTRVSSRQKQADTNLLSNLPSERQYLKQVYRKQYKKNVERRGSFTVEEDREIDQLIEYLFEVGAEDMAARLFVFDTGFFDLTQQDNSISHIYWIPLVTGHPDQPTGGVFYLNCSETMHEPGNNTNLRLTLSNLTAFFSGLYGNKQMQEITHQHDRQRNTAAAVAIISRNISHNVGSHVMSYQKYMLSDPRLILANGVLGDLVQSSSGSIYNIPNEYIKQEGGKYQLDYDERPFDLPYLQAKGHFDGYLQGRHDYIGAVASDTTFYYGAVNLREEVLEYFLHAELEPKVNHPGQYQTNYAYNNNERKRCILLERIAWSENFQRSDIQLTYDESEVPDATLSLPAGIVGRQALFSIFENIIRNTAKHGARREEGRDRIELNIKISPDDSGDFFKITITDNSGSRANDNLDKIQSSLRKPLIRQDGSGQIDESQKGIKEMQISAAWMRGITPRDINEARNKQALQIDYNDPGLCYTFYVRKAKKVLLVGRGLQYEQALPSNWGYLEIGQLIDRTVEQQYDLALVDKAIEESIRQQASVLERLPVRQLDYDLSNLRNQDLTDERTCEELEKGIYAEWLNSSGVQQEAGIPFSDLSIGLLDREQKKGQRITTDCQVGLETDTEIHTASKYQVVFRQHNDTAGIFRAFAHLDADGTILNQQQHQQFLDLLFVEGITGNNTTARLLRDVPKDWWWCQRIKESAMTSVMLIDERTWKEITDPRDDRNDSFNADIHYEYWKYTKKNIHIYTILPSRERKNKLELVNLRNEVEAIIDSDGMLLWGNGQERNFHFISFHQGLLDKLPSDSNKRLEFFSNFRQSLEPSLRYYMHSGRSFNPDLPPNVGFIPLSSLDAALRDCKYVLTELLYAGIINPENR